MRPVIRSLAVLVLFTGVPVFAQDLTIVSKVTRDGGPPQTTMSYVSSDHIRVSHGNGEAIFDLKAGQMTILEPRKKTYYVITRQDMDAWAARVQEQMNSPEMKKAQEQMKNLSPEERKRMDSMMGMFAFDVRKTGTTRKIAGYTCENWTVTMGQFSRSEECLTRDLQLPVSTWDMYRGFADKMKSMTAAMGPMAKGMANMQEQFKKMKGYPLASTTTVDVMGRKLVSASEVAEIKRGPIPASVWEIPPGYTKVDNPMLKALQPRRTK